MKKATTIEEQLVLLKQKGNADSRRGESKGDIVDAVALLLYDCHFIADIQRCLCSLVSLSMSR